MNNKYDTLLPDAREAAAVHDHIPKTGIGQENMIAFDLAHDAKVIVAFYANGGNSKNFQCCQLYHRHFAKALCPVSAGLGKPHEIQQGKPATRPDLGWIGTV